LIIPDDRVAEVVSRLTGIAVQHLRGSISAHVAVDDPLASLDSFDRVELLMELEEEFGAEAVRRALQYVELIAERSQSASRRKESVQTRASLRHPLWDRHLDE
jgi:acyl carrier protein